jgi:Zn-dependent M32 family carboxypeptidase
VDAAAAPLELLRERLAELTDLEAVSGLLGWDQETMMPPGGVHARADHLSTLDRLVHERLTAAEVGEWLDALNGASPEQASSPGGAAAGVRDAIFQNHRALERLGK